MESSLEYLGVVWEEGLLPGRVILFPRTDGHQGICIGSIEDEGPDFLIRSESYVYFLVGSAERGKPYKYQVICDFDGPSYELNRKTETISGTNYSISYQPPADTRSLCYFIGVSDENGGCYDNQCPEIRIINDIAEPDEPSPVIIPGQTGWVKSDGKWYYVKADGSFYKGWLKDNNSWYYFKSSGEMATGWLKDGSAWYYLKSDGAMV